MRRVRNVAVLIVSVAMLAPSTGQASNHNLLPNPSFEDSVVEPLAPLLLDQPVLPEGWIFEGSAGLFDHYPAGSGGRTARSGQRAIAVSIPASTKNDICADPPVGCHDNPIDGPRATARQYYSITPHWRTAMPVPVTAGQTYRLRVWASHEIATEGEGARTMIRWLDASGVPIGVWNGPQRLAGPGAPDNFWACIQGTRQAPAGAAQAHILLGHTDDLWIGQVRFDDAFFGLSSAPGGAC